MASKRPLVIDCDPGNDDATAILMALNDPDVDVKAITCVEGNTDVKQTARNALRTLHIANRLDVSCNTLLVALFMYTCTTRCYISVLWSIETLLGLSTTRTPL